MEKVERKSSMNVEDVIHKGFSRQQISLKPLMYSFSSPYVMLSLNLSFFDAVRIYTNGPEEKRR